MIDIDSLRSELALFADLGTEPPRIVKNDQRRIKFQFFRSGERLSLELDKESCAFFERCGEDDSAVKHASYPALLASPRFCNLRSWANAQYNLLRKQINEDNLLSITGTLALGDRRVASIDEVDAFLLKSDGGQPRLTTLLIDGPAGVGKTLLISQLALRRARNFTAEQRPLILHVQSKGRVLSFLTDLMAFSLQTMRAQVTYDQLPVLVRHGLVQLAIDGFDELGDPEGYDLAWAQLAQTVDDLEGKGALILAGRETFIGRERLVKALPKLSDDGHEVGVLSLRTVEPGAAKAWLSDNGWQPDQIKDADAWGFFEPGSYVLRPFFLATLAQLMRDEDSSARQQEQLFAKPPLLLLAEAMIDREADKFGARVDQAMSREERKQFITTVMIEAARDMAENQTDAIDEEMLIWLVDMAIGDGFDDTATRLLKNRVSVLGFLANDERRGYRKFAHSEFQNYFLSQATLKAVISHEVPKYLRRSILGSDFLLGFCTVVEAEAIEQINDFVGAARALLRDASTLDRSSRNIAALLLAALPLVEFGEKIQINGVTIDDAVLRGKAKPAVVRESSINQLDIRGADVSAIEMEMVDIASLIVDQTTRVSETFPDVGFMQLLGKNGELESVVNDEISQWLDEHGRRKQTGTHPLVPDHVKEHPIYILLDRVCRVMLRHHWIRTGDNDRASRLLSEPYWDTLRRLLQEWKLLTEDPNRQAGGPPAVFFHVKYAIEILSDSSTPPEVGGFLKALVNKVESEDAR